MREIEDFYVTTATTAHRIIEEEDGEEMSTLDILEEAMERALDEETDSTIVDVEAAEDEEVDSEMSIVITVTHKMKMSPGLNNVITFLFSGLGARTFNVVNNFQSAQVEGDFLIEEDHNLIGHIEEWTEREKVEA